MNLVVVVSLFIIIIIYLLLYNSIKTGGQKKALNNWEV